MNITKNIYENGIFSELGLSLNDNNITIDHSIAGRKYIHHSRMPVAIVGYTITSPIIARGVYPSVSFLELICKRPCLDLNELKALSDLCRVDIIINDYQSKVGVFCNQLRNMINKYDLSSFFIDDGGPSHYAIRPLGDDESAIKKWRTNFRSLSSVRQVMTATILMLYCTDPQSTWMYRQAIKKLHAVDGVQVLLENKGALVDWAGLYLSYPGW